MKLFWVLVGIGLGVAFLLPAATEAATCANAMGPNAILRFSIESNPVCSGQDLGVLIVSQNCSGQTQDVHRVIEVLDVAHVPILKAFDFSYTTTAGQFGFSPFTVGTTGAPSFDGYVRVTDSVAGQVSDLVERKLKIVAERCPETLLQTIGPYIAP